jgi:hypothetical protein
MTCALRNIPFAWPDPVIVASASASGFPGVAGECRSPRGDVWRRCGASQSCVANGETGSAVFIVTRAPAHHAVTCGLPYGRLRTIKGTEHLIDDQGDSALDRIP